MVMRHNSESKHRKKLVSCKGYKSLEIKNNSTYDFRRKNILRAEKV